MVENHHEKVLMKRISNFNIGVKNITYSVGAMCSRIDQRMDLIINSEVDNYQRKLLKKVMTNMAGEDTAFNNTIPQTNNFNFPPLIDGIKYEEY